MKSTAILVNTGRGSTVDESALFHALDQKLIAGAALDVFINEPLLANSPLLTITNVTVTPHIASITSDFEPKRKLRIGEEIKIFLSGGRPMNCVNWEELG
ncbi:MAG: NAD(P)-dependent oxidoreductase [Pseudomonadota bacterium]